MSIPVVQLDSVLDWLRLINLVLAIICAIGILTVPESPWRNDAASGARLLGLAIAGVYVWSAVNGAITIMVRIDHDTVPDYPIRGYGLLFWYSLTLVALFQRHVIGKDARHDL